MIVIEGNLIWIFALVLILLCAVATVIGHYMATKTAPAKKEGLLYLAKVTLTYPRGTPLATSTEYVLVRASTMIDIDNKVKNHFSILAALNTKKGLLPFLPLLSKDIELIPVL